MLLCSFGRRTLFLYSCKMLLYYVAQENALFQFLTEMILPFFQGGGLGQDAAVRKFLCPAEHCEVQNFIITLLGNNY